MAGYSFAYERSTDFIYTLQAQIVGYISTLFLVDELLQNVFSDISGIDAVFRTEHRAVTFTVINGKPEFVDVGDHHDSRYDEYEQTVQLVDYSLFTKDSPTFWFSLYPNEAFASNYETNNPAIATTVTVCIMLLTSLFFFLYDWFVRREFHAKRTLLDARRQFMRFVSHEVCFVIECIGFSDAIVVLVCSFAHHFALSFFEFTLFKVRTPLNSVSMGLDLLQADLAKVLGYESATSLRAVHDFADESISNDGEIKEPMMEDHVETSDKDIQMIVSSSKQNGAKMSDSAETACHRKAMEWFRLTQEIEGNTQG